MKQLNAIHRYASQHSRSLLLVTIALLFSLNGIAQDNETNRRWRDHDRTPILKSDIIGKWMSADTSEAVIEFVVSQLGIEILPKTHVNPFVFVTKDEQMDPLGLAINWPPYDAYVKILQEDQIEIYYYNCFSDVPFIVVYRRL